MFKDIHINKGPNVTISVASMVAIFFIGSILLFSTFLSQGVFADSMSASADQNTMSTRVAQGDPSNGNCARGARCLKMSRHLVNREELGNLISQAGGAISMINESNYLVRSTSGNNT